MSFPARQEYMTDEELDTLPENPCLLRDADYERLIATARLAPDAPTCEYAKRGEPHPLGVACGECNVTAYPIGGETAPYTQEQLDGLPELAVRELIATLTEAAADGDATGVAASEAAILEYCDRLLATARARTAGEPMRDALEGAAEIIARIRGIMSLTHREVCIAWTEAGGEWDGKTSIQAARLSFILDVLRGSGLAERTTDAVTDAQRIKNALGILDHYKTQAANDQRFAEAADLRSGQFRLERILAERFVDGRTMRSGLSQDLPTEFHKEND